MRDQGFLATYKGELDDRDDLIWTSASSSRSSALELEKYWVWEADGEATKGKAILQSHQYGDHRATPNESESSSTRYFLGMDCDYTYVAVYEGTPDDPGDWIWRARVKPGTSTPVPSCSISFYVMGDVPYTNREADVLQSQINDMNEWIHPGSHFMVHLGDFNRPDDTGCKESHFNDVSDILWNAPLPTFVLAGDNDFLECPDKEDAWENFLNTFLYYEEEWNEYRKLNNVLRWDYNADLGGYGQVSRPDMFSFYQDGIVFMSLALLNMKDGKS